ncbi:MAG: hypothetical protein V9E96_13225 [Chitinophagaceae bacterium]
MKKTLPIIVVLITLSLLGLIALQASWLKNLLEVRQSQLLNKVKDATTLVANDLSKAAFSGQPFVCQEGNLKYMQQNWHLKYYVL